MPPVLTASASVMCSHGGKVALIPRQMQVMAQGGLVMCEPDLVGAPVAGCATPPTSATKPCTVVVSVFPGSSSLKAKVGGRPVYLATLSGVTDGVPPGSLVVVYPGQTVVQA
jgi:hypothetical protein